MLLTGGINLNETKPDIQSRILKIRASWNCSVFPLL